MQLSDSGSLTLLAQGGFASLFVWLLIDTRKEAKAREEQLNTIITAQLTELGKISKAIVEIEAKMPNHDAVVTYQRLADAVLALVPKGTPDAR